MKCAREIAWEFPEQAGHVIYPIVLALTAGALRKEPLIVGNLPFAMAEERQQIKFPSRTQLKSPQDTRGSRVQGLGLKASSFEIEGYAKTDAWSEAEANAHELLGRRGIAAACGFRLYSPPWVDRIWLWVRSPYTSYAILLKGDYIPKP